MRTQIDTEAILKNELGPLLEIKIELIAPDIMWKPDLGSGGVRGMINDWFKSFMTIGTLMKR